MRGSVSGALTLGERRGTSTSAWLVLGASGVLTVSVAIARNASYSGAAIALASVGAIVAVTVGIRRYGPLNRAFWWLCAVALATGVVAGLLTALLPPTWGTETAIDLVYAAGYTVFVVASIYALPRRGEGRDWASVLDSVTLAIAVAMLFWYFAVSPALATDLDVHTLITAVVWPVYDITMVMVISRLATSTAPRDFPFAMVVLALASSVVVDFWYAATADSGGYVWGQVSDALWVVPMACLAAAGLHPAMRTFASATDVRQLRITWPRAFGVGIGTFAVPIALGVHSARLNRLEQEAPALLVFASLLVLAGMARTAEMVRQARNATEDLQRVNGLLESTLEERSRLNAELGHRAGHDSLTGLPNRDLLRSRLEDELGDRRRSRCALLFVDLDDFKNLNDTLGHRAGDRALVEVGSRISAMLRPEDLVARLGGDEFAVLLVNVDTAGAEALATRLLAALLDPIDVGANLVLLGASVGVAFAGAAGGPDELIRDADIAMYRAKGRGKNRVSIFQAEMYEELLARAQAKDALAEAMDAGELQVEYQPVVQLLDGRVAGVEALVHWSPSGRPAVPTHELVRLAERTGLVPRLGRYVLDRAATQVTAWRKQGIRLNLAVNVSSPQLRDPLFGPAVIATLEHFDSDRALVLVLTESSFVLGDDPDRELLEDLRARGCRIAVHDLGTGFSSLAHLDHLPIDVVKMDKLFVQGIEHGAVEASLAQALVAVSQAQGYHVVAEGIETVHQRDVLVQLGCTLGQGDLFARPCSAEEITALVAGSPQEPGSGPAWPLVAHVGVGVDMGEPQA